jgi:non-lysosomal glucosylceramidase
MKKIFKISFVDIVKIRKFRPRDQKVYMPFDSYPHGMPLGGFGAGTIGRSPLGNFNIWHLKVGAHIEENIDCASFHLFVQGQDNKKEVCQLKYSKAKNNIKKGYYAATYPKALHNFETKKVVVATEQFSPVLPHNYKETSYPVAIFNNRIKNKTKQKLIVSLMFTFPNICGWGFEDKRPRYQDNSYNFIKRNNKQGSFEIKNNGLHGILLSNLSSNRKAKEEMDGQIGLATLSNQNNKIFVRKRFYVNDFLELIEDFSAKGELKNDIAKASPHQSYGSAVAVKVTFEPEQEIHIPFFLVWDLPVVNFADNKFHKHYTKYFGCNGKNAKQMLLVTAKSYKQWSSLIDDFHQNIVRNSNIWDMLPKNNKKADWYFRLLINELYFLADGGTLWDVDDNFGLLECYDYPFYETLDVRFYGSFPLLKFWPKIELNVMKRFADEVKKSTNKKVYFNLYSSNEGIPDYLKTIYYNKSFVKGAVPHDLGNPKEAPFKKVNAYNWQNSNFWKDLNSKFVLLAYRDYYYTKNKIFLETIWSALKIAAEYLLRMDKDKDGIPENEGYPDQTYDNWVMKGVSAYCGSLWLGSLVAMQKMALIMDDKLALNHYKFIFQKAKKSFIDKLWNGRYFNFCENNSDVMTEQLMGIVLLTLTNDPIPIEKNKIIKTLKTIMRTNFNRRYGLLNGRKRSGKKLASQQGNEIWLGANFMTARLMYCYDLKKEAVKVLKTLSKIIYKHGFFFRTPEGWNENKEFTATMYMRPNAIWYLEAHLPPLAPNNTPVQSNQQQSCDNFRDISIFQ